jgi:hypothetical protein
VVRLALWNVQSSIYVSCQSDRIHTITHAHAPKDRANVTAYTRLRMQVHAYVYVHVYVYVCAYGNVHNAQV